MRRMKFVWIDDRKEKVEAYRAAIESGIEKPAMKARIDLIEVKSDLLDALNQWRLKQGAVSPDLFIIDHVFNVALPFDLRGSSVAHLLRGTYARTPMVCVTANLTRPGSFDQGDLSEYMAVVPYNHLDDYIERLYAIAKDFRKIEVGAGRVREHLVDSLKAPARDREDLLRVLPEEFQSQPHATTEHRIARWIYNVLWSRPGFLYNRLHVATLLGLTENGFRKVEATFHRALYKGVFATLSEPRWWVSEVKRLLFSNADADGPSDSQLAGRVLANIKRTDHSVCYVARTSEPPPDCVAFVDATPDAEQRVVRHEFADQHPDDPGTLPGFEARLVLRRRRA